MNNPGLVAVPAGLSSSSNHPGRSDSGAGAGVCPLRSGPVPIRVSTGAESWAGYHLNGLDARLHIHSVKRIDVGIEPGPLPQLVPLFDDFLLGPAHTVLLECFNSQQ